MSGKAAPCRYRGTAYTTCVDGDPCCQACLHTDGHEDAEAAPGETYRASAVLDNYEGSDQ